MTMESFRQEINRYIDHKKHNVPGGGRVWGVEGTSVIIGPKCNKGPICNNIWTQV